MAVDADVVESLRAKFEAVLPHLDERQQRLVMAAEARCLGHGGIAAVACATGASRSRISQGIAELEAGDEPLGRVRRRGGGRKALSATDPGLVEALLALVEPTRRGDPCSPLCWSTLSTRKLAAELTDAGHRVGPDTVAKLLGEQGFSLQANAKTVEGGQHPDRDAQFGYLNDQAREHLAAGDPVISVDTKKKELVGAYRNGGAEWRPAGDPEQVKVHDFIDPALGKVNPYGVYDLGANTGWVSVGIDHDTAAFAVETIRRWWESIGKARHPDATRLLVTADSGGSNSPRIRLWKRELQRLADETGLAITVAHLPPGTSKWNKIEHRLFAFISMNWRGKPLISHQVILQLIGSTRNDGGLEVACELDLGSYPKGIKVTDEEMAGIAIERAEFRGEWNYTIRPRQ